MSQQIVKDNETDQNSRSCRVLSDALSDIIRHSINADFRDRCFEVLRTNSAFGARTTLAANLSSIVSRDHRARESQEEETKTESMSYESIRYDYEEYGEYDKDKWDNWDDFNQNPINLISIN